MDTQKFKKLLGIINVTSLSAVIPYKESAVGALVKNPSFKKTCKECINYYYYRNDYPDTIDENVSGFYCLNDEDLKEILKFWSEFNFPKFDTFKYINFNIISLDRENEIFKFPIYMEMLLTFCSLIRESYDFNHCEDKVKGAIESLESDSKYKGIKFILNFVKNLPQNLREQISIEDFYSNYTNGILSSYQRAGSKLNKKIKQWTTN